jgi:hypothetical protein
MIKSFYNENIAISFEFLENGILTGILKGNQPFAPAKEFCGLFVRQENEVQLCFSIQWDMPAGKSTFESVFSGAIVNDVMELNWLRAIDNYYESSGAVILSSKFIDPAIQRHRRVDSPISEIYPKEMLLDPSHN